MLPGSRRFEIQLSSKTGPIDVFLIQDPSAPTSTNHLVDPMSVADTDGDLLMRPFDFAPTDNYVFDLKAPSHTEAPTDYYGFNSDMFNVFNLK
jgi:hypothetical protein